MQKNIITIGREYGSGGYEIGRKLSEALGFQYYDKKLITDLADKIMVSESFIEETEEAPQRRNIFLENIPFLTNGEAGQADYIFKEQGKFIVQLAQKGNCIFVGRRADFYLKDEPKALHLFFYADMDFRTERIMKKLNCSEEEAVRTIKEMDRRRKSSYEYTTGRSWGNPHNYDRMICTSSFGIDKTVEEIVGLFK